MTFAPRASSAAVASSRVNPSSVPVITYVRPVSGPSAGRSSSPSSKRRPSSRELGDERRLSSSRDPLDERLGTLGPDPVDLLELLLGRVEEPLDVAEVARERLRGHPADVGDVQPEEDARERSPSPCEAWIASIAFAAEISAKPSSSSSCSSVSR